MGELQKKEEEMRQMFVQRVKEKEAELKEAEKEVSISCITSVYVRQIYFCFVFKTQNNWSVSRHVAAREIRPSEETPPGREKEAGRKEEESGR